MRVVAPASTSLVQLPIILARELGFYVDEGLDVTLEDTSGMSRALQSLLSGSADVVSSLHDQVIQMTAEGRDLRSFLLMLDAPAVALVVSPSKTQIRSIRDLKGKVVAATAPGSPVHLYVNYLLIKHGHLP